MSQNRQILDDIAGYVKEILRVTAYIRKDTHRAAKIALLSDGEEREFSELIQDLLEP